MKVIEIAFTGYAVADVPRARKFYEEVLGLSLSRTWGPEGDPQWLEYDIGPGTLAVIKGDENWPSSPVGTAVALEVEDFEAALSRLREHNVEFVFPPYESPVCWMVVVRDPDGNRVVVHKRKPAPAPAS